MSESIRVDLLNPVYWPEVRRGSERFVHDLAAGLIARGHRPRLMSSHRGATERGVEDGLDVVRVRRLPEGRLRRRGYEDHLGHLLFAYRELRDGDADIAHALYPTDGLVAARWSREAGGPWVLSYMGLAHRRALANRRLRPEITLRAGRRADAVVALSEAGRDSLERWLGIEARVISPGVDLDAFSRGGERAGVPTVFTPADAGQARKRIDLLVEACELLRRDVPELELRLAHPSGDALVERLEDRPGVTLVDVDETERLVTEYRSAWVTALPSTGEAFGLVLAESLACGTPVVGTDDGGIPEVVGEDGEVGCLFEGGAPELALALGRALELSGKRGIGARCRKRAELFDAERCAGGYEALYQSLLQ